MPTLRFVRTGAESLRTGQAIGRLHRISHHHQPQWPPDRPAHRRVIEDKLLYEIQGWEKGFEVHREFYAHLRSSKDYDEGSAAFSERRKPEFSQQYYDEKTKLPGVPIPAKK